MKTRCIYRLLVCLFLFGAIVGCAPALSAPAPIQSEAKGESPISAPTVLYLTPTIASSVSPTPQPESPELQLRPAILEQRLLVLEAPIAIRVGDSDLIVLSLEVDERGNITPTASIAGHQVQSERVQIPDVYQTHAVMAEARLDISGLEISPANQIVEAVVPGQAVKFAWSVSPREVGDFRGMIWLHLLFIPRDGGKTVRTTLSAQRIEIKGVNLLGMGGAGARWLGAIGAILGSLFGLDGVIGWVWKIVRARINKGIRFQALRNS